MGRFAHTKYAPENDSSASLKKIAKDRGVVALVIKTRKLKDGDGRQESCPCGCGEYPKSLTTTFGMGHDARLRGKLIRAHLMDASVLYVIDGQEQPLRTALQVASKHGWEKYLKEAVTRREAKNREVLKKATNGNGSKRLIKVGRHEYTGQVVAVYEAANGKPETYDIEYVTKGGAKKTLKGVAADKALAAK